MDRFDNALRLRLGARSGPPSMRERRGWARALDVWVREIEQPFSPLAPPIVEPRVGRACAPVLAEIARLLRDPGYSVPRAVWSRLSGFLTDPWRGGLHSRDPLRAMQDARAILLSIELASPQAGV